MHLLRLAALALFLLSLGGAAQAQQRPQPPRPQPPTFQQAPAPAQPVTPDQRGTDEAPFSVKVLPSPKTREEIAKEEQRLEAEKKLAFETQRIADYMRYLTAFGLILLIVALGQAGLFGWLLFAMRRGLTDSRTAAEAARDGAIAAHLSAKVSDKSIRLSTRAWVFASLRDSSVERQGDKIAFKVNVANYGLSPARLKEIHVEFAAEEPAVDAATYVGADPVQTNVPLGVGRENVTVPVTFSTTEAAPFIVGYVIYVDAFGDVHESRFCRRIIPGATLHTETAGSAAWNDFN
jgi:hypothetical protein